MRRSIIAGTLMTAICLGAKAEESESVRLKKLEDAVQTLKEENTALKKEIDTTSSDTNAANKLKISPSVESISLYGEARLRYFSNMGEAAGKDAGDSAQRERLRYRLRLGSDIKLDDNWAVGVLLETGNVARSANVTLGENQFFAKSTPPTLKNGLVTSNTNYGDSLFVGRVFLKYSNDWMTVEGGKIPNPFVSTRMLWDPDLSPEGFGEQFHYTIGLDNVPTVEHSKDGKMEVSKDAPTQSGMSVDLFANFGQFIYSDVGFENSFNTGTGPFTDVPSATDLWMLGWQAGAKVNFNKDTFFQVAPALYNYTGGGTSAAEGPFNGDNALVQLNSNAIPSLITYNQTGVNNLTVFDVPAEFDWKMWNTPFSVFGDFADNLDASTRAARAGHPDKGNQGIAYQLGLSVGAAKKKGDWELRGWWQHSDAYALDQNIVDDDIFDGRLNMEGFYAQATYMITNSVSVILQGSHGHRIDGTLGTPGFGALGTAAGFPLQTVDLVYVDLNIKF